MAAAIVDWRDADPLTQPSGGGEDGDYAAANLPYGAKDAEFKSVAELQQVQCLGAIGAALRQDAA